jgi:uncharacterized protein (DUF2461 family)
MRKWEHTIRCVGTRYWFWDNYTQFWQEITEAKAQLVAPLEAIKAEAYKNVKFDQFTEQLIFEDQDEHCT